MSGFTITITDAGRAALINAQNTGTNAFVLSQIGVSTQHVADNLATITALPNERKRLGTMAGDVVADDTLHVTIRDEGNDAYPMRAFGLYNSTGILFAVYSQPDPIIEKSAAAMLLLAVDAKLVALTTDQVEFGPVGFTLPPASETVAGITEVATDAETDTGTDNWRYITPRLLKRALSALSGFALLGHKHDAADTTSGVFNVGRIPALAMEKITGLANALAGKAAEIHTHTMAQVTGLVDALASKAAAVHQHHADDITSGALAVGRIPALAMEKITGLANALAGKASLAEINVFSREMTIGQRDETYGYVRISGSTNGTSGWIGFYNNLAERLGYIGDGKNGKIVLQSAPGYRYDFTQRPLFNGKEPWDELNFNPSSGGLFTATPDLVAGNNANNIGLREFETRRAISTTANSPMAQWSQIIGIPNDADNTAQLALGIQADRAFFRRRNAGNWQPWFELATTEHVANAIAAIPSVPNATTSVRGLALLATNAQTLAGTDASRSMTPAGLWSFAKSIGPSGYIQIPGTDLIIQWGVNTASMTEGLQHATLPVAFGGGCLVALANPRNPSAVVQYDWYMQAHSKWLDRITFYANKANDSSPAMQGFEWMAIGLAKGNPNPAYNTGGGGGTIPPGGGGGGGDIKPEV
ncbi:hypothetical protein WEU32_07685 [Brevundimonas sp. BH3]|uniref:gp53-like domain-containing protein n=1 Tax=Brevundimonas sp. BH3 TaxID=3133089 RepID=UPI0032476834